MICDETPKVAQCAGTKIIETLDSRSQVSDSQGNVTWELRFFILGTNDECEVMRRIEPGSVFGLPSTFPDVTFGPIGSVGLSTPSYPLTNLDVRNVGWQLWEVRATYGYPGSSIASLNVIRLPTSISLSTRGGNVRISQSIETPFKYPNKGNQPATGDLDAPDFKGAIEWDGKTVKGINVPSPMTRYSESWIFHRKDMLVPLETVELTSQSSAGTPNLKNLSWNSRMQLWETYTGTVHGPVRYAPRTASGEIDTDDPAYGPYSTEPETQRSSFRNWAPGSVLLDNVGIRQTGLNYFDVTFDFLIRNNYQEALPSPIDAYEATTELIDGWDHLWYYYEKVSQPVDVENEPSSSYEVTAPQPKFAYVERAIERRDFYNLGIGGGPLNGASSATFCDTGYDLMDHWDRVCKNPVG